MKDKKKVIDLILVIVIFGLTGSTTAFLSGYIMNWLGAEPWTLGYIVGYIFFIFPLYQTLILGFAFVFGRFNMFYDRQKKIYYKLKELLIKIFSF